MRFVQVILNTYQTLLTIVTNSGSIYSKFSHSKFKIKLCISMKQFITLFFSVCMLFSLVNTTTAQTVKDKKADKNTTVQTPAPKKTNVQYAPGAAPTVSQQIKSKESLLKKLKTQPEAKRTQFTKDRIARLEKEIVALRKKKAAAKKQ